MYKNVEELREMGYLQKCNATTLDVCTAFLTIRKELG